MRKLTDLYDLLKRQARKKIALDGLLSISSTSPFTERQRINEISGLASPVLVVCPNKNTLLKPKP